MTSNDELNFLNKLQELATVKDEKQKTQFFEANLKEILEIEKFLTHLFVIIRFYPKESREYKIINNFLNYINYLIDISLQHRIICDIYHFKKECIIYGDDYKNEYMSSTFQNFYSELLDV